MKLLLVLSAVFAFGATRPSNPAFHEPILKLYSSLDNQGQYSYGYSGSSSSKSESRSADGLTRGSYSYIDGDGVLQKVSYQADADNGFRVTATNLPVAPSGGAANSAGDYGGLSRGSTKYGSDIGLGSVQSAGLGRAGGDFSSGSYSFSAPATPSAGGKSGSAGLGAGYSASAGLATGRGAALGAGLGSGATSYSFGSGTAFGVGHEAGIGAQTGSGGSYSFSAPAVPSNANLYGAPAFGDSSLLSGSPTPPRDTPEVLAAKARHFAAFEAAKINAATSLDDSAQHDDGQYRPNPSEDDGSYRGEGNVLGSGFKVGVEAYDDGQYRPNPNEDDGSYKDENKGLGADFGGGYGAGAGFGSGAGFGVKAAVESRAGLGSAVDAGKGAGAGISPGGLPGVSGSGAGIGAGYGAGLGAGAKPGFKGLDAVSASGAGAGAGYGAGIGAQISQLGAAAGFGPFGASAGIGPSGAFAGIGPFGASAGIGPFGASAGIKPFGASVGSGPKTPASTRAGAGYGAHGFYANGGGVGGGTRTGYDAVGGHYQTPASTQSSDGAGYGAGARGSSTSALGRYGSGLSGRFYSIPRSFPGFSQYFNQQGLGQYTYGYSADDQSSHQESRSSDGSTQGKYSYIDTNGILQTVKYVSDAHGGFRVKATNLPIAPEA